MTDMEGVLCDVRTRFLYECTNMLVVPSIWAENSTKGPEFTNPQSLIHIYGRKTSFTQPQSAFNIMKDTTTLLKWLWFLLVYIFTGVQTNF
jgi:hypothetical protein